MSPPNQILANQHVGLVDAVDRLLDKGVVINGDAMVSLAGVDLVYLRLSLLLSSVQRLSELGGIPGMPPGVPSFDGGDGVPPAASSSPAIEDYRSMAEGLAVANVARAEGKGPSEEPPANEARDLGRLVLTLVDLLRRVLERQALRRMEGNSLPDDDAERMGLALMELDSRMTELCEAFGLKRDELDIDLGPLGKINT